MPSHSRPFANLIIRERRKVGGIAIDGVLEEVTTVTMRATEFPIESGATVSDHVIELPMTYQMTGVITDTPMGLDGILKTATGIVNAVSGLYGKSEPSAFTRSTEIYNKLTEMMKKKEVIEVQTTLGVVKNLIFESITVNQDKDNSRSVPFVATFKQILKVSREGKVMGREDISGAKEKESLGALEQGGRSSVTDIAFTGISP